MEATRYWPRRSPTVRPAGLRDGLARAASLGYAERFVAGKAFEATPGDRAERFHGDRSHARRGASLTSSGESGP